MEQRAKTFIPRKKKHNTAIPPKKRKKKEEKREGRFSFSSGPIFIKSERADTGSSIAIQLLFEGEKAQVLKSSFYQHITIKLIKLHFYGKFFFYT